MRVCVCVLNESTSLPRGDRGCGDTGDIPPNMEGEVPVAVTVAGDDDGVAPAAVVAPTPPDAVPSCDCDACCTTGTVSSTGKRPALRKRAATRTIKGWARGLCQRQKVRIGSSV